MMIGLDDDRDRWSLGKGLVWMMIGMDDERGWMMIGMDGLWEGGWMMIGMGDDVIFWGGGRGWGRGLDDDKDG